MLGFRVTVRNSGRVRRKVVNMSDLGIKHRVRVRVRVRCFVVTGGHKCVLYGSVAEGGGRGSASRL